MNDNKKLKPEKVQPQRKRFLEMAKELESDTSGEMFERAFSAIVPPKAKTDKSGKPS